MTRRAQLLVLVVVLALAVGGAATWWLLRDTAVDCPARTAAVDVEEPVFVDRDALLPAGSVGDERAAVVRAAEGLPPPFGPVLSGRFYGFDVVPQPVVVEGGLTLVTPTSASAGPLTVQSVSLPDGTPSWTRTYPSVRTSGGPVGPLFVTAVGAPTPALVSVEAGSGDLVACVEAPHESQDADTALVTDQAGSDVVLAATSFSTTATPATLSRIDPALGEVRWQRTLDGPGVVGSVSAGPDEVVVSRVGHDPVKLAEMAQAAGIEQPMVAAYSLDDGSPTWTYPTGPAVATTAASVLSTDSRTGETYVLAVAGQGREDQGRGTTNSEVVALDSNGNVLWEHLLGPGLWDGTVWGDLLVLQGPDPAGGAMLRALERSDGSRRWSLSSRDFPAPPQAVQRFGPPATVGDQVVVSAPGGLALIDPATGEATPVRTSLRVDQVLAVGDHLLLRAGTALLVLELED